MTAGIDKELESFRRRFQHMTEAVQNSSYRLDWTTCNEVVLEHGSMRLRRFLGEGTSSSAGVPVLLVYSHVNSPHVLDLMNGHSLVEKLVDAGHAVYLLDWGDVNESDRVRPLANYILDYIDLAVDAVCRTREVSSVSLVGVCQGGTFSLCYASIFPDRIARLATLITPVDFHAGGSLLTHWCKHVDTGLLERAPSNIPGTVVNGVFQLLRPFSDLRRQVQMIAQSGNGENLELMARMDQWVFSGPDQPARAFAEFLRWFFQDNRLVSGELVLGEHRVNLSRIESPVFNIFSGNDHIVPPDSARALAGFFDPDAYRESVFSGGHIGLLVSRRAQQTILTELAEWLAGRDPEENTG